MAKRFEKDDTLLLIDQGNVLRQRAGYLAIPWAFKRIINRVLTPRELAVYVQIAFWMGKQEVCYPSLNQLAEDMWGVSRGSQLSAVINRLVDKGFLLKAKRPIPWRSEKYKKLVFQRPSVEYTLHMLRSRNHLTKEAYRETLEKFGLKEWVGGRKTKVVRLVS